MKLTNCKSENFSAGQVICSSMSKKFSIFVADTDNERKWISEFGFCTLKIERSKCSHGIFTMLFHITLKYLLHENSVQNILHFLQKKKKKFRKNEIYKFEDFSLFRKENRRD